MDTAFKGEHLLPGHMGQFFTILSFGSAIFAAISYFFATNNPLDTSWKRLGRVGAYVNTASVIGIGVCLYYIILNHLFEYDYAYEHSSRALPTHFIISSFWDAQEGSFWLWTFWQAVLSNILIWKAKSWESPVLAVISLSQAILATMLIGVDIFGARLGSSPFILLRDAIDLKVNAPVFTTNPELYHNYLAYITDGNGMNPLLENYWMVIHPPTLFLGFASMVVPFAYAIAGLWQKRYKEWVSAALPYALFAMMILGTGIIMGAFWAYESLSFGGFWAWDPVENASIIPWLVLVGAVHVMIVYKNTGHSYITATILVLASFVLVLYASFLTRSGILVNSVHAFTDAGLFWHLVFDVVVFLLIAVVLLVIRWKNLPKTTKDENTYSREFWMFVGAVFLALSCFHLVAVSSIDVWNAIFRTKIAPPSDTIKHYNTVQGSFAVVVTLLIGFTQFLKYKKTDNSRFFVSTFVYLVVAVLLTLPVIFFTEVHNLQFVFILLMTGAIYAIMANGKVLIDAFTGKFKLAGSAVAHIGFGFIMVGALISAGTSKVISENNTGEQFSEDFVKSKNNPRENIILYKNTPVKMGKYTVTYVGDSLSAPDHYFKVDYKRLDANGKIIEEFMLKPNGQVNPKMGLIASPDTKHYLFSDLYTHVNMFSVSPDEASAAAGHDEADDDKKYESPIPYEVAVGDTIHFREGYAILTRLGKVNKVQDIALTDKDIAIGAKLKIVSHDKIYEADPVYMIRNNNAFDFARKVDEVGLKFRFSQVLPKKGKVEISVYQEPESAKKWIVMRAIQFPDINFLWSGTIIMVIGILLSIFRRNKELKPE